MPFIQAKNEESKHLKEQIMKSQSPDMADKPYTLVWPDQLKSLCQISAWRALVDSFKLAESSSVCGWVP